jgi:hypothetical protein
MYLNQQFAGTGLGRSDVLFPQLRRVSRVYQIQAFHRAPLPLV